MDGLLACPVCERELEPPRAHVALRRGPLVRRGPPGLREPGPRGARPAATTRPWWPPARTFLAGGWFDPLSRALADRRGGGARRAGGRAGRRHGPPPGGVLDALGDDRAGVALDASVYAARRAARAHPRAMSVVADAWGRLPLLDDRSPRSSWWCSRRAAGAEIARVLAPRRHAAGRGHPGQRHLGELAEPLGLLAVDPDKEERLTDTLGPDLERWTPRELRWTMALDPRPALALAAMGPSARHVGRGGLAARIDALPEPVAVTGAVTLSRWRAPA